ncbi:peptide chain release factor N(5)-glutamine methyltransferase [Desemzia sp. RIT804]|uniref:peptide chain release factor N(5)-glutamine methyltransferase n=1 Tax=Desemzia sp. RIT 804 TaxID=2810209 RepID=UPI00194DDB92|nr:peptide chain release factor N(5)-glutamine methyltransferase [Desemzia sp. RIT 804]MBM6614426.1 peptide chain release factor N(5)-glutamine methyltransferase [Desemzia sp. RIT 804]
MITNSTYREVLKWASSFLETSGKEGFAAERLLMERQNWNRTDFVLHLNEEMPSDVKRQLLADVAEHGGGRPIQHILGYEWFYGIKFKVTHNTLIPRPETEEIVDRFLQQTEIEKSLKVLDIGTGTGAIAVTIKKERPQYEVTATDLSAKALTVAKENAEINKVAIRFMEGDLTQPVRSEKFDVILSNPPYIGEHEKNVMDQSVLDYEPPMALFAENNGLLIYQRLAKELPQMLSPNGQIYLEIGYQQGQSVKELFEQAFPSSVVRIEKDLSGHDRMLYVQT